MDDDETRIAEKYEALRDVMDEQVRRLWAATEARARGYGGVSTQWCFRKRIPSFQSST
jgi:hypothetical protein